MSIVEYVWLDANNNLRSKARTNLIGEWNYDGSSTEQSMGDDSDVTLKPVAVFNDPFRGGNHKMVFCANYSADGTPLSQRDWALDRFSQKPDEEPWYGLEQEYYVLNADGTQLATQPQGEYYCGVGHNIMKARELAEKHYRYCLQAGIKVSGINAEVGPGQWEYQVGPCVGIQSGDQVWMSRYILQRLAEEMGYQVEFHPKPLVGNWNGSGCHTNFSTKAMREDGGATVIDEAIEKLSAKHMEHIELYGEHNDQRLVGAFETGKYDEFSSGVADRTASVRIPRSVEKDGKGYLEDRRPASNCDPYLVTGKLFETCCL